jgi:hypothetical protein
MTCAENFLSRHPPSPVANISEKNFLGALFFRKVPLETGAPQLFDASYAHDGAYQEIGLNMFLNRFL